MTAPSVSVLALGGTIAMATDAGGGVTPQLDADALLAAVPGLDDTGVKLTARTWRALPSASLTLADLAGLAALIRAEAAAGQTGVVVTQGTDTLEETAYYLDLTVPAGMPVVVTGAMRNPTLAGADGPANLLAAVQVAAAPAARDRGCLVVFNDEVHAARLVRKAHTTSTAAFVSPDAGPLGRVAEGVLRLSTVLDRPARTFTQVSDPRRAEVAVLTTALGEHGALLPAVAEHYDGLVLAALGGGHVPAPMVAPLAELAARMPVVLASRTGAGPILRDTYGFAGSERDLLARGLVSAGSLDPYKARILLHLLLAAGTDAKGIADTFDELRTG